jgi:hypothetical protein
MKMEMEKKYFIGEGEILEMGDPQWLVSYRSLVEQINSGSYDWSSQQVSSQTGNFKKYFIYFTKIKV